jgi:hypothetical protein
VIARNRQLFRNCKYTRHPDLLARRVPLSSNIIMDAEPTASDSAPRTSLPLALTPISATKLLLGPKLFPLYTAWKLEIASTDEAQHSESTAHWKEMVAKQPGIYFSLRSG